MYQKIRSFYPRTEGSEGERKAIEYIQETVREAGFKADVKDFENFSEGHSFSRNIEVRIAGESPDTLMLAVPLNHKIGRPQKRDGSVNIAIALSLIRYFAENPPPVSLHIAFLGAEYGEGEEYPMGSRQQLLDFYPDTPYSVFYLNLQTVPSRIVFETGGRGVVTPYWLILSTSNAVQDAGVSFLILGNRNQVYRIGLTRETAVGPYLKAGFPGLAVEGWYNQEIGDPGSWYIGFRSFIDNFIMNNRDGFPERWDRNYLFFQILSRFLIIDEYTYVIIIIAVLAATLGYGLLFRDRVIRYLKTLLKNFWNLPLFVWLIFFFLFISTILLDWFLEIRGFPSLWEYMPFPLFFLKIAVSVFLFALLLHFLRNFPLSKNGSFYSASTLLLLILDILIFGIINIDFSYYFLWAFIAAFLFSIARNKYFKIFFILISPIWIIKFAIDIFTLPELQLCRVLLLSPLTGNILLAVITLPFLLMIIRIDFLFRHPVKKVQNLALRTTIWTTGIISFALIVFAIFYDPFSAENPLPVTVTEVINLDEEEHSISIEAPRSLGEVSVNIAESSYDFFTLSRQYRFDEEMPPDILLVERNDREFLDRHQISITLSPDFDPSDVRVFLSAQENIVIYDSVFPVSLSKENKQAEIHIGMNPPNPLQIRYTIPRYLDHSIRIEVRGRDLLIPLSFSNPPVQQEKHLSVLKTISAESPENGR